MIQRNILSLILLTTVISLSLGFTSLSSTQVDAIKRQIRTVVRGSTLPTAVRLSFHDCVGGCDGCLNVNNHDNAGLADLVSSLDTVYTTNSYDSVLSRADFWALAGIYAVDKTIQLKMMSARKTIVMFLTLVLSSSGVGLIVTQLLTLMLMLVFLLPLLTTLVS